MGAGCYGRPVRLFLFLSTLLLSACGTNAAGDGDVAPSDAGAGGSVCGDGILGSSEECDDGDSNSDARPDACRTSCRLPACGDGVVDSGEECDGTPDCTDDCRVRATCGDGDLTEDEECDDGNYVDGDGCSSACVVEHRCGDGVVGPDEECDDGGTDDGDGCSADCAIEHRCGDGVVGPDEECDDGGTDDGDGCSSICVREPRCGDGFLDAGEECDDGNLESGDGCSEFCMLPVCGDGIVEPPEECDDGDEDSLDGCTTDCQFARCGDGFIQVDEECDDGVANGTGDSRCHVDCTRALCGDGVVDPAERCDTGDPRAADCFLCGFRTSRATLVNLFRPGSAAVLRQPEWFDGAILGPIASPGASVARPVAAGAQTVDLALGDDIIFADVETTFPMGPSDHYSFVLYGDASEPGTLVVREDESVPPEGGVRFRAVSVMDPEAGRVTIAAADREFESEVFIFGARTGQISRDATRPAGPLTVEVTLQDGEITSWEFNVGNLVSGADHTIYVGGTRDAPVVLRTSTNGEITSWEFNVGNLVSGADHTIYVGGTRDAPVVLRTSTNGESRIGERLPD